MCVGHTCIFNCRSLSGAVRSTKDGRRFMKPRFMKPRSLWIPGIALWMVLILPWAADAQETNLSGTVTDATDAVLPGVSVTAVSAETGNTIVAVTDAEGRYRL